MPPTLKVTDTEVIVAPGGMPLTVIELVSEMSFGSINVVLELLNVGVPETVSTMAVNNVSVLAEQKLISNEDRTGVTGNAIVEIVAVAAHPVGNV